MRRTGRFLARVRLRSGLEFRRTLARGRRVDGRLFLLVGAPNDRGYDRLGLTVSRRVGSAPMRNRAKRLVRESFRRYAGHGDWVPGLDLVVLAKKELTTTTQADVDREYESRLRRLEQRTDRRRRPDPPPAH